MKNHQIIRTIVFAAIFTLASFAQAGNPTHPKKEMNTARTVQRYFKFPSVLMHPVGAATADDLAKVEVLFTTDESGKVTFVVAKTPNQALKAEIEKQFYGMPFRKGAENTVHRVILNFRIA